MPIVVPGRHRELAYRATLDGWTPDGVRAASDAADTGNFQELADLCESILSDDRVDGVLDTRTHGLLGLPLTFTGGRPEARTALEGDEAPGEWYRQHPEGELVKLLRWGILMGIGLGQRVPLPRLPGSPQRYRLETWSPRWLMQNPMAQRGQSEWSVQTTKGLVDVVPGAGTWILFRPYGTNRPHADGKWRKLVFPWLLKHFALEDKANMGQAHGTPRDVATAPQGANERQRAALLSQLVALGKKGKIILPDGWKLEIQEASGRTWEQYDTSIAWADGAMTIVLAGQVVTTEGSPGFSSGNVQERIVGDLIRFDAETFATGMHEQSLMPWAWETYEDPEAAPYPRWDTARPLDKQAIATTWEIAGRAIADLDKALSVDGKRVDAAAVADSLGVPLATVPEGEQKPTERIQLAPTDVARSVTLNEVRINNGLGPLLLPNGQPDPRGDELMSEIAASGVAGTVDTGRPPTPAPTEPQLP